MAMTRRELLAGAAALAAGTAFWSRLMADEAPAGLGGIRLGVCDWSIGAKGLAAMEIAKKIGLDGIQISPDLVGDKLSLIDPKVQQGYRDAMAKTGMKISSVGLTLSNSYPLSSEPRAAAWLDQLIDATAAMGLKATLLAFFGNGDLTVGKEIKTKEIDAVVARLKEAAPKAKEKGVVLGIESYLSARDLMNIMDRVGSPAVGVYYDIANTTARGYDIAAEIRQLKGRICEFHFKDNKGRLGKGEVKVQAACEAIREIGFKDWIVFEGHYGNMIESYRENAALTRKLLG